MPASASSFMLRLLDAESRLGLSNPAPSFDALSTPPVNALQRMFLNPALETHLSAAFNDAFGSGLVLNRLGGSQIAVGMSATRSTPGSGTLRRTSREVQTRPPLHAQGDGVLGGYAGILAALATPWPVLLIDEPEAFLHPPQACALGRRLATISAGVRQIIIATHSADVVRGLLDGPAGFTAIHRLTRDNSVNHVASLAASEIEDFWSDPLLRFSHTLDGLFHRAVFVCESDADCRFYEAVLASIVQAGELPATDWLFVHSGGKHRMPTVVKALKALGVPTFVIADIDVLRDASLSLLW